MALAAMWAVSGPKLNEWDSRNLASAFYSCARLRVSPSPDWLAVAWAVSMAKLDEFNAHSLSNTLYACGSLGLLPPPEWWRRYWQASGAKLADYTPQGFSITMYACDRLNHTPPGEWLRSFWSESGQRLKEFTLQDMCNVLSASAQLDMMPPASWIGRFVRVATRLLPEMNEQDMGSTTYALSVLQLWDLPLWPALWARLCSVLPRNGWSASTSLNVMQMYQAYRIAEVERPGLLAAPDAELLSAAKTMWLDQVRARQTESSSTLHADVSTCLTRMGVAHANERLCDLAERSIDIAIDRGATPVALMVDGPVRFVQPGRQDGRTLLRNRMLAANGWRVVIVDFRDWKKQLTDAQQEAYLQRLLASV